MAWSFSPNLTPATGDEAMWKFLLCLVAAGWRYEMSGDGTANHLDDSGAPSTAGTFTDGAPFQAGGGAHRISNPGAWGILVSPVSVGGVKTRLSFWRGGGSTSWRFAKTLAVSNNGALVNAHLPPPTAPDVEALIFGTGTPGAEGGSTFFGGDGTYHEHCGADPTSGSFYLICPDNGAGSMRCALALDRLVAGSGPSGDYDPFVVFCAGNNTGTFNAGQMYSPGNPTAPLAWIGATGAGALGTWSQLAGGVLTDSGGGTGALGLLGVDQVSLKETLPPVMSYRRTNLAPPGGWKGIGQIVRYRGSPHATGDLVSVSSPGDWVCFQDVFVPWPTGTAFVP